MADENGKNSVEMDASALSSLKDKLKDAWKRGAQAYKQAIMSVDSKTLPAGLWFDLYADSDGAMAGPDTVFPRHPPGGSNPGTAEGVYPGSTTAPGNINNGTAPSPQSTPSKDSLGAGTANSSVPSGGLPTATILGSTQDANDTQGGKDSSGSLRSVFGGIELRLDQINDKLGDINDLLKENFGIHKGAGGGSPVSIPSPQEAAQGGGNGLAGILSALLPLAAGAIAAIVAAIIEGLKHGVPGQSIMTQLGKEITSAAKNLPRNIDNHIANTPSMKKNRDIGELNQLRKDGHINQEEFEAHAQELGYSELEIQATQAAHNKGKLHLSFGEHLQRVGVGAFRFNVPTIPLVAPSGGTAAAESLKNKIVGSGGRHYTFDEYSSLSDQQKFQHYESQISSNIPSRGIGRSAQDHVVGLGKLGGGILQGVGYGLVGYADAKDAHAAYDHFKGGKIGEGMLDVGHAAAVTTEFVAGNKLISGLIHGGLGVARATPGIGLALGAVEIAGQVGAETIEQQRIKNDPHLTQAEKDKAIAQSKSGMAGDIGQSVGATIGGIAGFFGGAGIGAIAGGFAGGFLGRKVGTYIGEHAKGIQDAFGGAVHGVENFAQHALQSVGTQTVTAQSVVINAPGGVGTMSNADMHADQIRSMTNQATQSQQGQIAPPNVINNYIHIPAVTAYNTTPQNLQQQLESALAKAKYNDELTKNNKIVYSTAGTA